MGRFLSRDDYVQLHDDSVWIIRPLIPCKGYATLFGKPKTGKSYLALQIADAVGDPAKDELFGYRVEQHGPVAYLQIDTPRGIWSERLRTLPLRFPNVWFADAELVPMPFDIMGDGFGWLTEEIRRISPVLLVVDTLREIHGLNENESSAMQQVLSRLRLAVPDAAILLVSHARKDQPFEQDPIDGQRGSGYVAGRMDVIMRLTRKGLMIRGRALEDTTIPLRMHAESRLFELPDAMTQAAVQLLATRGDQSDRDLARRLHELFPDRSPEACRSLIRRLS